MPVNYTYYSFTYRHFDYYHPVRSVIGTLFKEQNYETEVKLENVHFRTIQNYSILCYIKVLKNAWQKDRETDCMYIHIGTDFIVLFMMD